MSEDRDRKPVTNETCDARMETLDTKIGEIQSDIAEIKTDVKAALNLKTTVDSHERFISGVKKYGVWVLVLLATIALTGSVVSWRDLLKP